MSNAYRKNIFDPPTNGMSKLDGENLAKGDEKLIRSFEKDLRECLTDLSAVDEENALDCSDGYHYDANSSGGNEVYPCPSNSPISRPPQDRKRCIKPKIDSADIIGFGKLSLVEDYSPPSKSTVIEMDATPKRARLDSIVTIPITPRGILMNSKSVNIGASDYCDSSPTKTVRFRLGSPTNRPNPPIISGRTSRRLLTPRRSFRLRQTMDEQNPIPFQQSDDCSA